MLIHINFLFAGASLIYFSFFSTELKISFFLYIIVNCSIGYFLAKSVMTFFLVSSVFLISNLIFASFFFLKARRSFKPLSYRLFSNKREGIQILLVVYFLVLGVLLTQLNPGSAALSLYSNWLMGLGIQIGFLTALNDYFQNQFSGTRTYYFSINYKSASRAAPDVVFFSLAFESKTNRVTKVTIRKVEIWVMHLESAGKKSSS